MFNRPEDTLERLRLASRLRQVEWLDGVEMTLSFLGNELAGEVGEACNAVKKLEREALGLRGSRATREDLAKELADVIIVADLIAARLDIDLGEAIAKKFDEVSERLGLETRF